MVKKVLPDISDPATALACYACGGDLYACMNCVRSPCALDVALAGLLRDAPTPERTAATMELAAKIKKRRGTGRVRGAVGGVAAPDPQNAPAGLLFNPTRFPPTGVKRSDPTPPDGRRISERASVTGGARKPARRVFDPRAPRRWPVDP